MAFAKNFVLLQEKCHDTTWFGNLALLLRENATFRHYSGPKCGKNSTLRSQLITGTNKCRHRRRTVTLGMPVSIATNSSFLRTRGSLSLSTKPWHGRWNEWMNERTNEPIDCNDDGNDETTANENKQTNNNNEENFTWQCMVRFTLYLPFYHRCSAWWDEKERPCLVFLVIRWTCKAFAVIW